MKELSLNEMKNVEGGGGWDCFAAVAGFVGVGLAAVFAPPAGAALAAAIIGGGLSFGTAVISAASC